MRKKNLYKPRIIISSIVLILSILAILGIFYPLKILDIQLAALLQRVIVDFSIIAVLLFLSVLILTLLFGRLYCSTLCPFGILQEAAEEMASLAVKKKNKFQKNLPAKYFIAAIVFGALVGGTALFLRYFEPYTFFASAFTLSSLGVIAVLVVLAIVFWRSRFFCTNLCPVGTALGLISKFSVNKIYIEEDKCTTCGMCERKCPAGSINSKEKIVDNETCIKCLKCLHACPKEGLCYGAKPVKFDPRRRDFIHGASAIALFGIMAKVGFDLKEKIAEKIHDVILPPGAISEEKFINKCLNCNLCVTNCPQKIIKKANKDFGAVHIDYSGGFCEFDCNKCAQVCPTGAIKRIGLEEKQKTRIASAVVKKDACKGCKVCVNACLLKAIATVEGKSFVDVEKCIGCGICKKKCANNAIAIYSVKEQKVLD